jgi:hypothetical protein
MLPLTSNVIYAPQMAYRILSIDNPDIKVVIKPIESSGHGNFSPSSAEELRFYDFPYGHVVLQEITAEESEGAHLSPTVQFVADYLSQGSLCERIIMGSTTYGLRLCTASSEVIKKIELQASRLHQALKPQGAGGFAFHISSVGELLLTDIHTQFGVEHFTKLFVDMYGGKHKVYVSWSICPNASLDIWTLWTRLCDQNIGFTPGTSAGGVFPLLFLKGTTGTLIALANNDAEVSELRIKADQLVRLVETPFKMESVALCESRNQIWCQSARIEYRMQTQRYNLPSRCIGLLRPGRDVIVLPGGHEPTKEFWEFAKDILGFDDDQAIFTTGDSFCLDHDMDEVVLSKMRSLIQNSDKEWTFVVCIFFLYVHMLSTLTPMSLAATHRKRIWSNRLSGPRRKCHGGQISMGPVCNEMKKGVNLFGGPNPYVCVCEHVNTSCGTILSCTSDHLKFFLCVLCSPTWSQVSLSTGRQNSLT